jgi:tetratricopeptide (TPR) repeat protein
MYRFPSRARSLALGAALAALPAVAQAADPAPSERAADLYRRATKLYAAQQLTEAEPLYREAWQLHQSYDIASNLGALELELGKPVRAAELLSHALRNFPARGRPEERAALELRLEAAKSKVGALRITVGAAGAEVFVDGRSVGRAPLERPVFVEPGVRVIEAKLAGYADARLPLHVRPGTSYGVQMPLAPPRAPKRSAVPLIAGGAVAALAAGTGITLVALAEGQRHSAQALHDTISGAGASCAVTSTRCGDLHAATSKADALGNTGIAAFALAGAAAAGTAGYLLWPRIKPVASKWFDVRPSVGIAPGGGGVALSGSF